MNQQKIIKFTVLIIVFLAVVMIITEAKPTQARITVNITGVQVTNLRDGSFVVSWTTDGLSDGKVDWGISKPPGNITSDPNSNTTTHYVTIAGLMPNTSYYFQVRSGAVVDNNNGSYYSVMTGPTLSVPTPGKTLWGYVYQADGMTPAQHAIVYVQLQDTNASGTPGISQWASAQADTAGVWSFDLVNIRTINATAYFSFSDGADTLRMVWKGGIYGNTGSLPDNPITYLVPALYPAQFDQSLTPMDRKVYLPMVFCKDE